MIKYTNGNYNVLFDLSNGTKIRFNNESKLIPEYPESMDLKICNRCNMNCPMCHEKSTPNGELADIMSDSFIDTLRPYTELAIGGGNVLEHPDLMPFLLKCKKLNLVPSITVHQRHFEDYFEYLSYLSQNNLIYGLGVSLCEPTQTFIDKIKTFPNAVVHVINGIVTSKQLETLSNHDIKILILGYKNFGRGEQYLESYEQNIKTNQDTLKTVLPTLIENKCFTNICFDNLAIKQLDVRSIVGDSWDKFYMGDDGEFTMYVDMVNREFAVNSTSIVRYPLYVTDNIIDMFNVIRNKNNFSFF